MSRRSTRGRRSSGTFQSLDAAVFAAAPGAVAYYRAEDCLGATWPAYRAGPTLTNITDPGTAAGVAQLANKPAVRGAYSGSLALSGSLTMLIVAYTPGTLTTDVAMISTTVGGAINSAQSVFYLGQTFARNVFPGDDTTIAVQPISAVHVAAYAAGSAVRLYQNSLTAVANSTVIGAVQPADNILLSAMNSGGNRYESGTRIARAAYWQRSLSNAEAQAVSRLYASYYGLTLT